MKKLFVDVKNLNKTIWKSALSKTVKDVLLL